ncbi:hypothetical protein Gorai_002425 [Gossypium raimondii]|uniref:Uncharacterized protein n=1 Tax=Gossypium raimondii TaxID=29730 RepID=A0A7J8QKY4_GOSRA|nr:hypothetical protein [Gossypium raimondii]
MFCGVIGNGSIFPLTDLLSAQSFIWDNLNGFLYVNYKRQQNFLVRKMWWVVVVLVEFIKVA